MSSRRSRNGGTSIGKTLSLKNKSSLKLPFSTSFLRSRFVAASILTSTFLVFSSPIRSNSFSCNTLSNLLCNSKGISPTSSRNKVPPSASSNRPTRSRCAPVKDPFTWPKNSLSKSSLGIDAQFTFISELSDRSLRL